MKLSAPWLPLCCPLLFILLPLPLEVVFLGLADCCFSAFTFSLVSHSTSVVYSPNSFPSISIFPEHQIILYNHLLIFTSNSAVRTEFTYLLEVLFWSVIFQRRHNLLCSSSSQEFRSHSWCLPLFFIPVHSFTEFCWLYLLNIFWISPSPSIPILTTVLSGTTSYSVAGVPIFTFISLRFTFSEC